jgi:hypothetical protein
VKLSNLVGQGGLWYGFGRMIMKLSVARFVSKTARVPNLYCRLDDAPGNEISNILVKVCLASTNFLQVTRTLSNCLQTFRARLTEVIDQAQHFASINASGGGTGQSDGTLAFREGLDGTERECRSFSRINLLLDQFPFLVQCSLWRRRVHEGRSSGMRRVTEGVGSWAMYSVCWVLASSTIPFLVSYSCHHYSPRSLSFILLLLTPRSGLALMSSPVQLSHKPMRYQYRWASKQAS